MEWDEGVRLEEGGWEGPPLNAVCLSSEHVLANLVLSLSLVSSLHENMCIGDLEYK